MDTFLKLNIDTDSDGFRLGLWEIFNSAAEKRSFGDMIALNPVEYLAVAMSEC